MELTQLVAVRVEEVSLPLHEEVASLKLLLARVGDSLEPIEACSTSVHELATVQASLPLGPAEQKSSVVEEEHLYTCFSPHGNPCQSPQLVVSTDSESEDIDEFLAPLLQITPELHELHGILLWCFRRCCALLRPWRWPQHPRHRSQSFSIPSHL
jgi:hypothetical protein